MKSLELKLEQEKEKNKQIWEKVYYQKKELDMIKINLNSDAPL